MRIVQILSIIIFLVAIGGVGGMVVSKALRREEIDLQLLSMLGMVIVTAMLVFCTAFSVIQSTEMTKQTAGMVKEMRIANQINFRPYIRIEEATARDAEAEMRAYLKPGEEFYIQAGYLLLKHPETGVETFKYRLRNVGTVTARDIRITYECYEENEVTGEKTNVQKSRVKEIKKRGLCLLPDESGSRDWRMKKGTFYRNDTEGKFIRLKIRVTYEGVKDMDPNRYYYVLEIKSRPAKSKEEMYKRPLARVVMSDEGIDEKEKARWTTESEGER